MMALRLGLEIALMITAGVALLFALGWALITAERRGWIRLHGIPKGSASAAFAAMDAIYARTLAIEARQQQEERKRIGNRMPAHGDGLDDGPAVTGRFAGKVTVSVNGSRTADEQGERPSSPEATEPPVTRPLSGSASVTGPLWAPPRSWSIEQTE